jgi:uncharacterized protein (TIGR02266 family)
VVSASAEFTRQKTEGSGREITLRKDADMDDRRRSPRLDVVLKVRFESREDFKDALIHNISQTGVYLAMDAPFDVGYQFTIEINLPNDKGQINGKCEVIWVNEIEAENYPKGMGVQLVELEPKNRELLEEYLKELETA